MALALYTIRSSYANTAPRVSEAEYKASKSKPQPSISQKKVKAAYDLGYRYGLDQQCRGVNTQGRYKDAERSQAFIDGYAEGIRARQCQS